MIMSIFVALILIACLVPVRKTTACFSGSNTQAVRGVLAGGVIMDHLSQEMNDPGAMLVFSFLGFIFVACFLRFLVTG